jgi:hypothetical protein
MTIEELMILDIEHILVMVANRELIFLEHAVALVELGCLHLSLRPQPLLSYLYRVYPRPLPLPLPLPLDIEFKLLPLHIRDLLIGVYDDDLGLHGMVATGIGAIGCTGFGADRPDDKARWQVGISIGNYLAGLSL